MKSKAFFIIHGLCFIFFSVMTICYGCINYLALTLYCLGFLIYFLFMKDKDNKSVKNFICSIILGAFTFCMFSIISRFISYRPAYCYKFYKTSLCEQDEIFEDISHFNLKASDLRIFMKGHRGQVFVVSCSTPNTSEIEKKYANKSVATENIHDYINFQGGYRFSLKKYLISDIYNYKIYYTELENEHQSGVAINSQENIVAFFHS